MKRKHSAIHPIDIFEFEFQLIVANDIMEPQRERQMIKRYGNGEVMDGDGLCWQSKHQKNIAVFLKHGRISHNLIAHEVFHATIGIMDRIGHVFNEKNQEAHAYLAGHLSSLIYSDLKKWKIKVRINSPR